MKNNIRWKRNFQVSGTWILLEEKKFDINFIERRMPRRFVLLFVNKKKSFVLEKRNTTRRKSVAATYLKAANLYVPFCTFETFERNCSVLARIYTCIIDSIVFHPTSLWIGQFITLDYPLSCTVLLLVLYFISRIVHTKCFEKLQFKLNNSLCKYSYIL